MIYIKKSRGWFRAASTHILTSKDITRPNAEDIQLAIKIDDRPVQVLKKKKSGLQVRFLDEPPKKKHTFYGFTWHEVLSNAFSKIRIN